MQRYRTIGNLERNLGINLKTTFCRAKERDVRGTPFEALTIRFFQLAEELSKMSQDPAAPRVARMKIEALFARFGPRLWPDAGLRRHWLVEAQHENFEGSYPRDLYYSFPEDYKILRKNFCALIKLKIQNRHRRSTANETNAYARRGRIVSPEEDTDSDDELATDQRSKVATRMATNAAAQTATIKPVEQSIQVSKMDQVNVVDIDDSDFSGYTTEDPDDHDSSNGTREDSGENIMVQHSQFKPSVQEKSQVKQPTSLVCLKTTVPPPSTAPLFLHVYFGNDNMSESSRISLRLCDTVSELFERIDGQRPDSMENLVTKKIRIVQGQPTKTFRICKNGEFEFEAWKNFLDEQGGTGDMKPIGYAGLM